jgi:hypothetical protein
MAVHSRFYALFNILPEYIGGHGDDGYFPRKLRGRFLFPPFLLFPAYAPDDPGIITDDRFEFGDGYAGYILTGGKNRGLYPGSDGTIRGIPKNPA